MSSLLPEIKLKKILDYLFNLVRQDYQNNIGNEQESFLYKIFGGLYLDNYDFFTQSKAILLRDDDNNRKLEVRIFFDRTRAHIPTIHINLPNESPNGDSLSYGLGNIEPQFSDDNSEYRLVKERCFDTKYNLTITSDNTFEVLIVYSILKAILIAKVEILELNGLRNPKIMGSDLMVNNDQTTLFMRVLNLNFLYEFSVPELEVVSVNRIIDFTGSFEGKDIQNVILNNDINDD